MSFRRVVPAEVPSEIQGSKPLIPLLALKTSLPFKGVSLVGKEEKGPLRMSLTLVVPAAVPLVTQSSLPLVPSSAVKKSLFPMAVRWEG